MLLKSHQGRILKCHQMRISLMQPGSDFRYQSEKGRVRGLASFRETLFVPLHWLFLQINYLKSYFFSPPFSLLGLLKFNCVGRKRRWWRKTRKEHHVEKSWQIISANYCLGVAAGGGVENDPICYLFDDSFKSKTKWIIPEIQQNTSS